MNMKVLLYQKMNELQVLEFVFVFFFIFSFIFDFVNFLLINLSVVEKVHFGLLVLIPFKSYEYGPGVLAAVLSIGPSLG